MKSVVRLTCCLFSDWKFHDTIETGSLVSSNMFLFFALWHSIKHYVLFSYDGSCDSSYYADNTKYTNMRNRKSFFCTKTSFMAKQSIIAYSMSSIFWKLLVWGPSTCTLWTVRFCVTSWFGSGTIWLKPCLLWVESRCQKSSSRAERSIIREYIMLVSSVLQT